MKGTNDRNKRVRRLKKMIVTAVFCAVAIPLTTTVILGIRVAILQNRITEMEGTITELEGMIAQMQTESSQETGIYTTASVEMSPRSGIQAGLLGEGAQTDQTYEKKIYLTFDDGPSRNTDRILDILEEYDVKATFFVVGKTDEESVRAYQRIVAEGHTLAMHSYSHKYTEIYESLESFIRDFQKLQEYLYQVTGVWPRYYRFPGGSSNTVSKADMQELIQYLEENNITYFDWNIESGDAVSGELSVETITRNCVSRIEGWQESMILMHDASERNSTVDALPRVIEQIRDRGDTVFLPITDETIPIQHVTAEK